MQPIYRMTVFQNDGVTALTPRAGAPHSDAFKVATASSVAGFQPYMQLPQGRRGKIDPLKMKTDTGWISVGLLDPAVATLQDERWVTAFVGDSLGENQLIGKPVLVEESTDAGSTWASFFRGRIQKPGAPSRTLFTLSIRDTAEDQQTTIFLGDPSVSYANAANIMPLGLVTPFGALPTVPMLPGIVRDWSDPDVGSGKKIEIDLAKIAGRDTEGVARIITGGFLDLGLTVSNTDDVGKVTNGRVHIEWGANSGEAWPAEFSGPPGAFPGGTISVHEVWYSLNQFSPERQEIFTEIGIQALDAADPEFVALPVAGTAVDFYIKPNVRPTRNAPLLIDWVHPVQLWQDILSGKFGPHDGKGVPEITVDFDAAAFATLIADVTIPQARFQIEKSWNMADFIEQQICLPYGLSYRIDSDGNVVPLDMRMPTAIPGTTIVENDLTEKPPGWQQDRGSAFRWVDGIFFTDQIIAGEDIKKAGRIPDVPAVRIQSVAQTDRVILGDLTVTDRTFTIKAMGYRILEGIARKLGSVESVVVSQTLHKRLLSLRSPFGHGMATIQLIAKRVASTNGCFPGDLRVLQVPIPNAADVKRSGSRVVRCVSRQEDGPKLVLGFLDLGASLVAVPPTLGVLRLLAGAGKHKVEVNVTRNGSGEDVVLEYAITATTVGVRPAATSDLWTFGTLASVDGFATIASLASGSRIWVRGRTEPAAADQAKIPSSWAFPTPGSIDTVALSAPTGFVVAPTGCSATASWTNTETGEPIELLLDGALYDVLLQSAQTWTYEGLITSTAYTGEARYADGFGGVSPLASDPFTTSATPDVAPAMLGIGILVGEVQ